MQWAGYEGSRSDLIRNKLPLHSSTYDRGPWDEPDENMDYRLDPGISRDIHGLFLAKPRGFIAPDGLS